MSARTRILALLGVLLLVETASYWKLSHWLFWTNDAWLAHVQAFGFICLLLGAVVALSSELPDTMHRQVHVAGITLLIVQALANVMIAYQVGRSASPLDVVTRFFSVGDEVALKGIALVQGGTLSIVSISFWSVIGHLLRQHWKEQQALRARLDEINRYFQEASHE